MRTLRSQGESQASAYIEAELPPSRVEPTLELERVALLDPRRTPTLHSDDPPKSSGPRNPEQMRLPDPEPSVELPEGLPLTVAQPVYVPPELAEKWREEARQKGAA